MKKINCPNVAKNLFILLIVSLVFAIYFQSNVYALTSDNINFQGKIVRNDTGYEGLNVVPGSPACVVSGAGNDTCDFQVAYYTASTGGTLLLTELFSNVEIGQYDGVFELSLGSGSMTTTSQCRDGTCNTPVEVISEYKDLYLELKFSPDGTNLTETFTRMPLEASPYSILSKYAEGANDAFKLSTSVSSQSQASPVTGMVYYNTTTSQLTVYDGDSWEGIKSSLWTDAGTFTYLTSTTDDLILGASTVSDSTFFFDMDGSSGSYLEIDDASNTNRLLTILSGGNVGIGTATPGAKLEVAGSSSTITNASGDLTISTGGLNGNILLSPHGTGSVRVSTSLGIRETGTTPTYYTTFQGGDQAANITYTLPTSSTNGLLKNTAGVWSWDSTAYISQAYSTIQEEGTALTQRSILNFVGSGFTAADDGVNTRTNVSLDTDLNALADLATTGIVTRTAANTFTTREVAGTSNRITITNGTGVGGNPTVDIASTYVGQTSITTLGTIATGTWNATAISATKGGTGQTTYAIGDILYASSTSALSKRTIGTAGQVLTVTAGVPTWEFPAAGHDSLTLTAIGTTPNANAATLTNQVLNLEPASASFGGVVTTGAQIFAGAKSFESTISIKETGTTPTYYTTFQGGDQAANITYTLPTSSTNGLLKNTAGVWSWDTSTYITGLNWSQITNGTDVWMDYKPNNTACSSGEVLKYSAGIGWTCSDDNTGGATAWDDILNPDADKVFSMDDFFTDFQYNTFTAGSAYKLSSTSVLGSGSDTSVMLEISKSGANTNTNHTAYGIFSTVSNTNATSGTNIAGYFSASGATTANYGLLVANGNVGIGTTTPSNKFVVNTSAYSTIELQYGGTSVVDIFSNASSNIFIGSDSGSVISSGIGNIALGDNALSANTTGLSNTAIGYYALDTNVAKQGSTALGYQAMANADSTATAGLSYNTAIGYQALTGSGIAANNTGTGNTAIGHQSMTANTSGYSNTALGVNTLNANTTGYGNVSIGYNAMFSNVGSSVNVAIGYEAMRYSYSGAGTPPKNNIGIGYQALMGSSTPINNTGTYNIALGSQSLVGNTSGDNNISLGQSALYVNTSGSNNFAVGYSAMNSNSTGGDNIAIGQAALATNISGSGNVAIGGNALGYWASGSSNDIIAIGRNAMYMSPGTSNNIAVGTNALESVSGNNNIGIGYQSGVGLTSGQYNILIGYQVAPPVNGTTSNQLNIGDLILGNMASGSKRVSVQGSLGLLESTGATYYTIFQGGDQSADITYTLPTSSTSGILANNGSGTLSWSTLASLGGVTGTGSGSATAGQITWWSGTSTITGENGFWWDATNNRLGIGTSSPTASIDIAGASSTISNASGNITITPASNLIVSQGYVGIGTASPTALLSVGSVPVNSTSNVYQFGYGYAKTDTSLRRAGTLAQSNEASQPFAFYVSVIGAAADANRAAILQTGVEALNNSGNLLLQPYAGKVGIGTLSPVAPFDLFGVGVGNGEAAVIRRTGAGQLGLSFQQNGNSAFGIVNRSGGDLAFVPGYYEASAGTEAMRIVNSTGNVGIGTTSPQQALHVYKDNGATAGITYPLILQSTTTAAGNVNGTGIEFFWQARSSGAIETMRTNPAGNYGTALIFKTNNDATSSGLTADLSERMRIDSAGNVGIGMASPGGLLHLGDIYASGGKNLIIGDDTYLTDVDTAHTLGLYSNSNTAYGSLKLGVNGGIISGYNGYIGIGTSSPAGKLHLTDTADNILIIDARDAGQGRIFFREGGGTAYGAHVGYDSVNDRLELGTLENNVEKLGIYIARNTGYVTLPSGHADLAENYQSVGRVLRGSLVSINTTTPWSVTASNKEKASLVGVVTTNPGAVMDADGGFQIGYTTKLIYQNEKTPIALVGTAPTLVTLKNGYIEIGDSIGVSELNGFGAKMTTAGYTVGKALEKIDTNSCISVSSLESITWPEDDGKNTLKPCYRLTDGTIVGKIMVAIQPSWYDPRLTFTTENISIPGWYRIASLNSNTNDYGRFKINNTSVGSSQNLLISVDSIDTKENINVISNFTSGDYNITKTRINSENGTKYLEIYLPNVNGNQIKVSIDGGKGEWVSTSITQVIQETLTIKEYSLSGVLFGVSDMLKVQDTGLKVGGDLIASTTTANIGDTTSRWNDIYAKGAIRLGSGSGQEGAIRFNTESKRLELSNDGSTWVQLGDLTSQVVISPEYPGAILFADGSDNLGLMTSDAIEENGTFKNYYEWISNKEVPQDYDILVRITLPNDFVSWKDDAIYLDYMTENSVSVENNSVDVSLIGNTGVDAQSLDHISTLPGTWERMSLKSLDINECNKAGDSCTLRISLTSSMEYFVRVGDITLNYSRSL